MQSLGQFSFAFYHVTLKSVLKVEGVCIGELITFAVSLW